MTFATVLVKAMLDKGYSLASLSRATGSSESTISYWRTGRLPTVQKADVLAELLDAPMLRILVVRALSRRCVRCRKKFLASAHNRNHTKYCGKTCRTYVARHHYEARQTVGHRRLLLKMERAVEAHCRGCEPMGLCRDAQCSLRSVSPLPFIPMALVTRRVKVA